MIYYNKLSKYLQAGDVAESAQLKKYIGNSEEPSSLFSEGISIADRLLTHYYRIGMPIGSLAIAATADSPSTKAFALILGSYLSVKEYLAFKRTETLNEKIRNIAGISSSKHHCVRVAIPKPDSLDARV